MEKPPKRSREGLAQRPFAVCVTDPQSLYGCAGHPAPRGKEGGSHTPGGHTGGAAPCPVASPSLCLSQMPSLPQEACVTPCCGAQSFPLKRWEKTCGPSTPGITMSEQCTFPHPALDFLCLRKENIFLLTTTRNHFPLSWVLCSIRTSKIILNSSTLCWERVP